MIRASRGSWSSISDFDQPQSVFLWSFFDMFVVRSSRSGSLFMGVTPSNFSNGGVTGSTEC